MPCIAARGLIYFPLKLGAESDSTLKMPAAQASMKGKDSLNGALSMGCTGEVSSLALYVQSLLACCHCYLVKLAEQDGKCFRYRDFMCISPLGVLPPAVLLCVRHQCRASRLVGTCSRAKRP